MAFLEFVHQRSGGVLNLMNRSQKYMWCIYLCHWAWIEITEDASSATWWETKSFAIQTFFILYWQHYLICQVMLPVTEHIILTAYKCIKLFSFMCDWLFENAVIRSHKYILVSRVTNSVHAFLNSSCLLIVISVPTLTCLSHLCGQDLSIECISCF